VAAVDDDCEAIRRAAFEAIVRMENERDWCEPSRGDPNVDVRQLAEAIASARDHPDPKIRELAGPPPMSPNMPGGGMF
jgi:hypothetical protein